MPLLTNKPVHANTAWLISYRSMAIMLLVGLFCVCGCGGGESDSTEASEPQGVTMPTKLTFHMTNNYKETLKQIMIEGFAQNVKYTSITSGGSRSLLGMKPMDMAKSITVSWANPRGSGRKSTSVKASLPKNFNGTLYFTITSSGKVKFRAGTM